MNNKRLSISFGILCAALMVYACSSDDNSKTAEPPVDGPGTHETPVDPPGTVPSDPKTDPDELPVDEPDEPIVDDSEDPIMDNSADLPSSTGAELVDIDDDDDLLDDDIEQETENIIETEPGTLVISKKDIAIASTETAGTFSVTLSDTPKKSVSIAIASEDASLGTVTPKQIEFTDKNWNVAQEVTVTRAHSEPSAENKVFSVKLGPSQSEDKRFANLDANVRVTLRKKVDKPIPLESIKITASSKDLLFKDTITLTAELTPANTTQSDLEWFVTHDELTPVEKEAIFDKKVIDDNNYVYANTNLVDKEPNGTECKLTGNSRLAKVITVTVKEKNTNKSQSIEIKLKPYAPLTFKYSKIQKNIRDFKTSGCSTTVTEVYNYTPDGSNITYQSFGDLPKKWDSKTFSDVFKDTLEVINRDLYIKYVLPNMYVKTNTDGKKTYYGTRASVVAAARFLVLQFPYDIPYYKITDNTEGKSHYVWTTPDKSDDGSKVRMYGVNLSYNMFGSYKSDKEHILAENAIPWGVKINEVVIDKNGAKVNKCLNNKENGKISEYRTDNEEKLPPNGLACSGFVTWAFRNGRFNLGDWYTDIFAKIAEDNHKCGTSRNYQCEKFYSYSSNGNNKYHQNNYHDSLFNKLSRIDEIEDFVSIDATDKLKKMFRDGEIKAGDLLWRRCYDSNSGHVAMILGINKNKNGDPIYIYVGESIGQSGNYLKYYDWNQFTKLDPDNKDCKKVESPWIKQPCDCKNWESYIIKMDNVYNYMKEKDHLDVDLDTYNYTDYWIN